MDERKEMLQCLVENRAFAPSHTALAKELGYKGRMTVYRLMAGNATDGTVDKLWQLTKQAYLLDDLRMYRLARTFYAARHFYGALAGETERESPGWAECLVASLVTDDYGRCSGKFRAVTAPVLVDLKADEPEVYWGMTALVYLRATATDFYREGPERASRRILAGLDGLLHGLYPEKEAAHDAAANLLSLAPARNLCGLLSLCVALLRNYAESGYRREATRALRSLGLGKRSYWREPGRGYGKGQKVWLLTEQTCGRMTNCYYLALCMKAGGDIQSFEVEDVLHLEFWDVEDDNDLPVLQACRRRGAGREWGYYLYEYDGHAHELRLEPVTEAGSKVEIPGALSMISLDSPADKDEKVWARILREWDRGQGKAVFTRAKEAASGITDMTRSYRIADMAISRTALTLAIEHGGSVHEYQLPVGAYGFLSEINPSQSAIIVRHEADGQLYVSWPELGYSIRLDQFAVE